MAIEMRESNRSNAQRYQLAAELEIKYALPWGLAFRFAERPDVVEQARKVAGVVSGHFLAAMQALMGKKGRA